MDHRTNHPRNRLQRVMDDARREAVAFPNRHAGEGGLTGTGRDAAGATRGAGASADAPFGSTDSRDGAMPSIGALGALVRRSSLIAAAVHACETASADARSRRASNSDSTGEGC